MKKENQFILFGGSFDPIHNGHLAMARFARESLNAERVIFIPAARSPLKPNAPVADGADRMAMIQIAITGIAGFEVSDVELRRPEPSYTIDTISWFRKRYGQAVQLHWLVGADMVAELPSWYCIGQLLDACRICFVHRAGLEPPNIESLKGYFSKDQIDRLAKQVIKTPLIDISSTHIRQAIKNGQDVREMLPNGVLDYITRKKLYNT